MSHPLVPPRAIPAVARLPATASQLTASQPPASQSAASQRLSPTARARLIYGEAKAGTATRLWEAMLGDRVDVAPVSRRASVGENGRVVAVAASDGGWSALLALPMPSGAAAPANLDSAHRDASSRRQPPTHAPTASPPTASVMPLGPNQDYAPWLRAAADRTGVPGPAIAAIVGAEAARGGDGRWLPLSRNPRSSAAGLGQFLSRTWIGEAERAGTWLHQLATTNGWLTAEGRVRRDARSAVLALRYDARAAIETVADHARHNLAQLRAVKVIAGESLEAVTRTAYVAHHLGIGDAIQFLRDALDPARAARLLVAQIGVNAAADRIGRSVDAVAAHRSWLTDFMARAVKPRQTY